jgi:CBS domain containing-hemolysin-like protein
MLLRLLRFGGLSVEDVMVPRADIVAIDQSATVAELVRLFKEAGVSRIPVYHETLDDPRGMVHVKDLLRYLSASGADGDLAKPIRAAGLLRPVLNVPPSMPAVNLLIRMQTTRHHIALVVDEYGGTDGLVTIEDLVELVVGEIEDEYDVEEAANITEDGRHGLVAQGRTPIAELEQHLGLRLLKPDEVEIDTVGGLVVSRLGRVPVKGELVAHESGIELEVLDADPRRIKRLRVHRPSGSATAAEANREAGAQPRPAPTQGTGERPVPGS